MGGSAPTIANTLGFFAAKDSKSGKLSFVIVNKDTQPASLSISNVPAGKYFLRHFGGAAGIAKWQASRPFHLSNADTLIMSADEHDVAGDQLPRCAVVHRCLPEAAVDLRPVFSKGCSRNTHWKLIPRGR